MEKRGRNKITTQPNRHCILVNLRKVPKNKKKKKKLLYPYLKKEHLES